MKAVACFNHQISGYVLFEMVGKDKDTVCKVTIKLENFEPCKTHAIHIHEYGDMRQGCKSAGGHYNPFNKNHGCIHLSDKNRHVGDLINNITSDENGKVNEVYYDNLIKVYSKNNFIIGRSVVIHDGIDDLGLGGLSNTGQVINEKVHEESLKNGNAGCRIDCAIIGICKDD